MNRTSPFSSRAAETSKEAGDLDHDYRFGYTRGARADCSGAPMSNWKVSEDIGESRCQKTLRRATDSNHVWTSSGAAVNAPGCNTAMHRSFSGSRTDS